MRVAGFATLLVAVFLLAGCGSEAPRQAAARIAVEDQLAAAKYDRSRTQCTGNPRPWFVELQTDVFICAARRRDGGCDWYRATLRNAGWEVLLERRDSGCVLPF